MTEQERQALAYLIQTVDALTTKTIEMSKAMELQSKVALQHHARITLLESLFSPCDGTIQ